MQTQLVLLILAILSVVGAEVKLDDPVVPQDVEDETPMITPVENDPAQVLEELERQIFDQVVEGETSSRLRRPKSPKKCCKLGREVATNGLFCNPDMLQVRKRPNIVHRRKMKFHGPEVHGKTVYKDLMRQVEKCALGSASESMFVKCCEWQESIMVELEQCKTLPTLSERRRCRRRVQSRA